MTSTITNLKDLLAFIYLLTLGSIQISTILTRFLEHYFSAVTLEFNTT